MATNLPLFSAVSSSARQILLLLRCISFAKMATVRITPDGLRFSTEEGSVMEAFVHLEKNLFTSYKYTTPSAPPSSQDDLPDHPLFEINLLSLLETLNIFSVSDPSNTSSKRSDEYSAFAAHRLNRHANQHAFNNPLQVAGICTFSYDGEGSPLTIHMSEAGVTTTCDLTTYEAEVSEEIPFQRDSLALKTIMRSTFLLDALSELNNTSPQTLTIHANPNSHSSNFSLSASGPLGSATIDYTTHTDSDSPVLETFQCPARTTASFKFSCIKAAQRAMQSASKVSLRLDEESVLSLQFLVEVGHGEADGAAFVDFRVVPLVDGEAEDGGEGYGSDSDD
ncbi:hypothetical protein Slin15195_G072000 [Septoria linicola]|uniref:DNA repair exonuclease rad1 n=1 Tax=Septoria linicola TaxID=215465 RepID=A0A9Q9EJL0_9PEZI|nr:hypothetical protein Slin15195_G072000 [Septoria linicola]